MSAFLAAAREEMPPLEPPPVRDLDSVVPPETVTQSPPPLQSVEAQRGPVVIEEVLAEVRVEANVQEVVPAAPEAHSQSEPEPLPAAEPAPVMVAVEATDVAVTPTVEAHLPPPPPAVSGESDLIAAMEVDASSSSSEREEPDGQQEAEEAPEGDPIEVEAEEVDADMTDSIVSTFGDSEVDSEAEEAPSTGRTNPPRAAKPSVDSTLRVFLQKDDHVKVEKKKLELKREDIVSLLQKKRIQEPIVVEGVKFELYEKRTYNPLNKTWAAKCLERELVRHGVFKRKSAKTAAVVAEIVLGLFDREKRGIKSEEIALRVKRPKARKPKKGRGASLEVE